MKNLIQATQKLLAGELVAFPTETVYGLGADASNPLAIRRIFAQKKRPQNHPVIVHVLHVDAAKQWATFNQKAITLANHFWPGPLTLVLPKKPWVPMEVTGGLTTIGIRVPSHPLAQQLLSHFKGGIAAPSANRFGHVSPTTAQHVQDEFGDEVFVLDGGPTTVGIESTIVDLSTNPALLRPGSITQTDIERKIGPLGHSQTPAPGTLAAHYAPMTSLLLADNPQEEAKKWRSQGLQVATLNLIEPNQYAQFLYSELRRLDQLNFDLLIAQKAPSNGIGIAINDRLQRAETGSFPPNFPQHNKTTKDKL